MRARRLLLGLLLPSFAASWAHSLWPDGAPNATASGPKHSPRITVVDRTEKGAQPRAAVVILPGGGYAQLSTSAALEAARWLNARGIVGYVVEYRLGTNGYLWPVPARDAARALRWARHHAAKNLGIPSASVGVWGFSAGGHLAALLAVRGDDALDAAAEAPAWPRDPIDEPRWRGPPAFAILAYPVVTMASPHAHIGSRRHLLGCREESECDARLVWAASAEAHVSDAAPPTFIFHTRDDPIVPVQNALALYSALVDRGVANVELHAYQHGPHGSGLGTGLGQIATWPNRLEGWLRLNGIIDAAAATAAAADDAAATAAADDATTVVAGDAMTARQHKQRRVPRGSHTTRDDATSLKLKQGARVVNVNGHTHKYVHAAGSSHTHQ